MVKEKRIKSEKLVNQSETLNLLYQMVRIRRFEEKCVELYGAMKIRGFLHLYIGEEAVAVGVITVLKPDDAIVATYREHGHALVRGIPAKVIMAEMYGKREGCCRGRGGSMHIFDAKTRFYGGNAIVGGGLPPAVGLALADQMQGIERVTCCFFGEGAVAEGEFHEAMNLAELWKLPVLFVCENNLYAMGTAIELSESETKLGNKVASYKMPFASIDGMDVRAVKEASIKANQSILSGNGPYFLECRTYRFRAHSMYDPELYRNKDEVKEWKKRDPITQYIQFLTTINDLKEAEFSDMESQIATEIEEAVEYAEKGTLEPENELTRFVYTN